ncbi:hypothetical protein K438DRAFT_1768359 [Mycena galopus ATCC 62051]|nr:hypothetical protein K438DRAFT_1768359 [Mycena galopus ATCC 62051]
MPFEYVAGPLARALFLGTFLGTQWRARWLGQALMTSKQMELQSRGNSLTHPSYFMRLDIEPRNEPMDSAGPRRNVAKVTRTPEAKSRIGQKRRATVFWFRITGGRGILIINDTAPMGGQRTIFYRVAVVQNEHQTGDFPGSKGSQEENCRTHGAGVNAKHIQRTHSWGGALGTIGNTFTRKGANDVLPPAATSSTTSTA